MNHLQNRQPEGLISVLLDRSAAHGDRDDAAMDLSQYPSAETEEALVLIASNSEEDLDLIDSCAESLASIWAKNKLIDPTVFGHLVPYAQTFILDYLRKENTSQFENFSEDRD